MWKFLDTLVAPLWPLLLVEMPFATNSFLLLVVRPGAPTSVLAPSSLANFEARSGFHVLEVSKGVFHEKRPNEVKVATAADQLCL